MLGVIAGASVRAVRTVHRSKQWVLSPRLRKSNLDSRRAQAHSLARDMASRAGASVGPKVAKERALLVDGPIDVQCSNDAGGVEEDLHLRALRPYIGPLRASTAAECGSRDCECEECRAWMGRGRSDWRCKLPCESTGIHCVYPLIASKSDAPLVDKRHNETLNGAWKFRLEKSCRTGDRIKMAKLPKLQGGITHIGRKGWRDMKVVTDDETVTCGS